MYTLSAIQAISTIKTLRGHSYSLIAILPERTDEDATWTIPVEMSRVPTESNSTQQGIAQVHFVLSHPNMPWTDKQCALVVDSVYGNAVSPRSTSLAPMMTETPSCASWREISNPMPLFAPVTSAMRFVVVIRTPWVG